MKWTKEEKDALCFARLLLSSAPVIAYIQAVVAPGVLLFCVFWDTTFTPAAWILIATNGIMF